MGDLCLFCNTDHKSTEPCESYKKQKSPAAEKMPALLRVLDLIVLEAETSQCTGKCSDTEPFVKCSGCLAIITLTGVSQILCNAVNKIMDKHEKGEET